ncbi:WAP four-disulfide core domain protein 5-like [Bombina bombina]|uniref:WAP four-disulfide core domain protein 5-like n=1 Tax=Bombina bombina TaxID=8345 RepID=UPI00235B2F60|nr:WAP four-disulfide core domain protein 5-like [Bombina bombina]
MTPVSGTVLLGLVLCIMVTCAAKTTEQRAVRVRVKRGICPLDLDYPKCDPATMTERAQCQTDRDCPGQRKCCISGCRSRCVLPLQQGGCPAYDPSICIYTKPLPNECHRDDQCPGAQRCCCLNCRRQCIGSQRVFIRSSD